MSKTSLIISICLTILLAVYFFAFPNMDLNLARHFYLSDNHFSLNQLQWPEQVRQLQNIIIYLFVAFLLLGFIVKVIKPRSKLRVKFLLYCLIVFVLVPGALVNGVFKNHFHRPRPRQVLQLGGSMQFKRPFTMTGQCTTNCSFVCGDAAAMFAFWLFLPFLRRYKKWLYGLFVAIVGGFYGYIRMGQGGHFFSDVIFAGLFSYIGIWIIYWFFYRYDPKWLRSETLENGVMRLHQFFKCGRFG